MSRKHPDEQPRKSPQYALDELELTLEQFTSSEFQMTSGGYLEHKNGYLCLRLADHCVEKENSVTVNRSWLMPFDGDQFVPFDKEIYAIK